MSSCVQLRNRNSVLYVGLSRQNQGTLSLPWQPDRFVSTTVSMVIAIFKEIVAFSVLATRNTEE